MKSKIWRPRTWRNPYSPRDGSQPHPMWRFELQAFEEGANAMFEALVAEGFTRPQTRTKQLITTCKIEWLPEKKGYAINPFIGCAHGCYRGRCWAYLQAKRQRIVKNWEEWRRAKINAKFMGIPIATDIQLEVSRLPEDAAILLSATTDPFQPDYFGYHGIIEEILRGYTRASHRPGLWVLTKSGTGIIRFLDYLEAAKAKIGITLTSLRANEWEPGADKPSIRLLALKAAKERRLSTYISIEPWIPDVTEPFEIIKETQDFTDFYIIGRLNYSGIESSYYRGKLPTLIEWLHNQGIDFFLKKEFREDEGRCEKSLKNSG